MYSFVFVNIILNKSCWQFLFMYLETSFIQYMQHVLFALVQLCVNGMFFIMQ